MPWFIQLIMAIFMIILYIAIFMGCVGELWNYDRFYIHEGYHSYLTEEMAKGRMCYAEIGIFEIPVGATVYINYAYREVVSTDIKYLGLLEE